MVSLIIYQLKEDMLAEGRVQDRNSLNYGRLSVNEMPALDRAINGPCLLCEATEILRLLITGARLPQLI